MKCCKSPPECQPERFILAGIHSDPCSNCICVHTIAVKTGQAVLISVLSLPKYL
jgi:hypothetical protein